MNTYIKNLIAIFILVACAFNVTCNKLKKVEYKQSFLVSDVKNYESIYVSSKSGYFFVDIHNYSHYGNKWFVHQIPKGVICKNCNSDFTGKDVDRHGVSVEGTNLLNSSYFIEFHFAFAFEYKHEFGDKIVIKGIPLNNIYRNASEPEKTIEIIIY